MQRKIRLELEDEDGNPVSAITYIPIIREDTLEESFTREGIPEHRLADGSSSLNANGDGTFTVVQTGQVLRKRD